MQQAVLSKRGIQDRLICSSSGDRNLAIRLADFPQPEAPGRDGVLLSAPYWDSRWKEPERGRIPACGMRPAPFPVFLLMTLQ